MASDFKSILGDIGNGLKRFFGIAVPVAEAAAPFIAVAFPGVAPLYNIVVNEVANAEAAAIVAGQQTGSGPHKLAAVLASPAVQAAFASIEKQLGVSKLTVEQQTAFINAAVASLNAIPAPAA